MTSTGPSTHASAADVCDAHAISPFCPVFHEAIELIGRRWTGAILRVLLSGGTRFSDVTTTIPGLSDRLLSERLKQLESEGIVTRTVYPETPVRVEYQLTDKGLALTDVVMAISSWAETWLRQGRQAGPECGAGAIEGDRGS
ncbi:MAG TPA: helix-turn-helix domain-containing protein [Thermomicrobiales bacterium]|nr:helix-turn-helix domain-containing protein [Thermomicrobiales bacterium]